MQTAREKRVGVVSRCPIQFLFRHIGGCHLTRESAFGAVMEQTIRE